MNANDESAFQSCCKGLGIEPTGIQRVFFSAVMAYAYGKIDIRMRESLRQIEDARQELEGAVEEVATIISEQ